MAKLKPHSTAERRCAISVLIPAFNVAEIILRSVRSALESTDTGELEVIVIDDASHDETHAVAQALASRDARVRVLQMEANGGPGAARAMGLTGARGDWIAVLDADDAMVPGRLGRLVGTAEGRQLDLIADNLILCDPEAGPAGLAFPLRPEEIVPLSPQRVLANSIPGGRVNLGWMQPVIRRDFLRQHAITWRPIRHGEDMLFLMEVLLAGARAELLGTPGYLYTQRRGSRSGSASPHSRTRRDAQEQIRALKILQRVAGASMPPDLARRLAHMPPEIHATSGVIHGLDHLRQGRYVAAASSIAPAVTSPLALARCIAARFGPRSRKVV
jgi:succinoglycan biosynthesis protein ExoO